MCKWLVFIRFYCAADAKALITTPLAEQCEAGLAGVGLDVQVCDPRLLLLEPGELVKVGSKQAEGLQLGHDVL